MSLLLGQHSNAFTGQDTSQGLFGVANLISDCSNAVHFNREAAAVLASRITDIVFVLSMEQDAVRGASGGEWSTALDDFKRLLNSIHTDLKEMSGRSYIVQACRRKRDADAIRTTRKHVRAVTARLLTAGRSDICAHVQALDTATPSAFVPATVTAQHLPLPPAYFFGRAMETESMVTMFDSDMPAYVAILGDPGMGKTSLARAVVHHPTLAARFGQERYFVTCNAADSHVTLLSLVSSAFGLATSSGSAAQESLTSVLHRPSLLVLDNFEYAWESPEQRQETETGLRLLSSITSLSIMITLRGSEHPQGIPWTMPHLRPLATLDSRSASQLFVTISYINDAHPDLARLLACTGHIPLAIVQLANLAQYETTEALLSRWEGESPMILQCNEKID